MSSISSSGDLRNRIIFTILILAVYRFGTFVPLPGIDPEQLKINGFRLKLSVDIDFRHGTSTKKNVPHLLNRVPMYFIEFDGYVQPCIGWIIPRSTI